MGRVYKALHTKLDRIVAVKVLPRRRWGDHNVFYPADDAPLDDARDLPDLYEHLRRHDGIAIPHHTAYQTGERGKDWATFDERLSPFAEIYSIHGCSEGYGSPLPLERGPVLAAPF